MADSKDFILGGSSVAYKIDFNDILLQTMKNATYAYSRKNIIPEYTVYYIDTVKALKSLLIGYQDSNFTKNLNEELNKLNARYAPLKKADKKQFDIVYAKEQQLEAHRLLFEECVKLMKRKGFLQDEGITSKMRIS